MSSTGDFGMRIDDVLLLEALRQFLYREARLCDEHRYAEWEALWTDDALYWIPANGDGGDPEHEMSIVYDNRSRIALRIRQLESGRRHAQDPPSRLCRLVDNVTIVAREDDDITLAATQLVHEAGARGVTQWMGRCEYLVRRQDGALRLARKKIVLVNNDRPLYTLAFLL